MTKSIRFLKGRLSRAWLRSEGLVLPVLSGRLRVGENVVVNGENKSPRRRKSAEKAEKKQGDKTRSAVTSAADIWQKEGDIMRPEIEIW